MEGVAEVKVIYVANFDAGGNEDENAILHALRELGHTVEPLRERMGHKAHRLSGDLLLFHKWRDVGMLRWWEGKIVRAFWWFDLVDYPDPTLASRCRERIRWMEEVTPHVELGFLSDGDWVANDRTGKLVWLTQGADERKAGFGSPDAAKSCVLCRQPWDGPEILMTGIRHGGKQRMSFVAEMEARWGSRFLCVQRGVHGRDLADLIVGAKIVVAPDGPVTDRYWSNRIFLTLGFGGFLLHPYCSKLANSFYTGGKEVVFYRDRSELHDKIEYYLSRLEERRCIQEAALKRTLSEHLYRHRVKRLLEEIQTRTGATGVSTV